MNQLPEGYQQTEEFDRTKPTGVHERVRRIATALGFGAAMVLTWSSTSPGQGGAVWLRLAQFFGVALGIAAIWLLAQFLLMKGISGETPVIAYRKLMLYPGVKGYFSKKNYAHTLLWPGGVLLVALGVGMVLLPADWRSICGLALVYGLGVSLENFYLAFCLWKKPQDMLIHEENGMVTFFEKAVPKSM